MSALTGYGIISAILTLSISSEGGQIASGATAVIFGVLGIAMEVADRTKERGVCHGRSDPGPS